MSGGTSEDGMSLGVGVGEELGAEGLVGTSLGEGVGVVDCEDVAD